MQNFVAVFHAMCPQSRAPWKHARPHMCYHTKFGRSRPKRMGVGMASKKSGTLGPRPFGMGRGWLLKTRFPLPSLPCQIWSFFHTSEITEICQKNLIARVPPLKVTRDTDRSATYDFLLVTNSNHGPISYRFRDKWWILSKISFSRTRVYNAHGKGVPRGIL